MPLTNPQAVVDRLALKRRRLIRLLLTANVAVALLLGLLVAMVLAGSRQSYLKQAQEVASGMAAVAQVNIGSELNVADAVIRATADELQRRRPRAGIPDPVVDQVLAARLALIKGVEAFRLTDASGRVLWGNGVGEQGPTDVSDRDYFQRAKRHRADTTIVDGPLRSRVSGNWVIAFARPLSIDGSFAGILYISVTADHFHQMFARYGLERKDAVTLRGSDLRLIARHSPGSSAQGEVGSTTVSEELLRNLEENPRTGNYVSRVAIDGEVRTTAYQAVSGWPFTVYAGISHDRFLQGWHQQAWRVSLLATLAWVMIAAASLAMYRASKREASAVDALADQTTQTQALLRIAGDGIHIVDSEGRLIEMSDSFAEMLGSTREKLLGRHVSTWDANQSEEKIAAWLAKIKDGDKQRVDVQHRRDDGAIIDVELQMRVAQVAGQLLVFGSGRDVTEVKRLMRQQVAMLESDLVGMAKVRDRRFTWRNAEFERIFGHDRGGLEGRSVREIYRDDETFHRIGGEVYDILRSGAQYRTQLRMRKKSGDDVWVDFGAVPLADGEVLLMAIDITTAREAQEHLTHVAFHDALTQLPNRLLLADRLNQALATSRRDALNVAVCYMDLDGFKAVNDEHGHDAGDGLLQEIARRLAANVRPSDTAARIGGDEFVILLSALKGDEWRPVLERIMRAVERPVALDDGTEVTVGATMGVVVSGRLETGADLLDRADRLMLQGKRAGKGRLFTA